MSDALPGEIDEAIAARLDDVTERKRGLEARCRETGTFFGPVCPAFSPAGEEEDSWVSGLYHPTSRSVLTVDFGAVDHERERAEADERRDRELQKAAATEAERALDRLVEDAATARLLAKRVEAPELSKGVREHPLVRLLARELPTRVFRPDEFERVVRKRIDVSNRAAHLICEALGADGDENH